MSKQQAEELKKERERRIALETELARLRAGAVSASAASATAQKMTAGAGGDDWEKKIKELQAQMWAAKGEAETIRRAQKEVRTPTSLLPKPPAADTTNNDRKKTDSKQSSKGFNKL